MTALVFAHLRRLSCAGENGYPPITALEQGAENIQRALGASSLEARGFGAGAIATYHHAIFGRPASFKRSYTSEFGATRRFESDTLWFTLGLTF